MHLIVVILSVINAVTGEQCTQTSNCECKFTNGSVIDLTSLGYHHEARFKHLTAKCKKDNFKYYYNPCFPFNLGGSCIDVAVCQVQFSSTPKNIQHWDCGNNNNEFIWNTERSAYTLVYTAHNHSDERKTIVELKCSKEATTPLLEVRGELQTRVYEMRLTSRCACPDLCSDVPVSVGSTLRFHFVFIICFMLLTMIFQLISRI
ncbi:uncharacterized protein [Parasteatoda tepidariorum]|uniref:uncharacterized protein n=1 Tax=Parasteatoda tepidariorum TaxID=114398 RepID=UPI001C725178|nr:uncharacterized protein LOC107436255 [Parasteatoda tepidariorum]